MAVDFSGTWKLDRSENFEDYLKELDINIVKRKVAVNLKPTQIIKQNGENFEVHNKGGPKDGTVTFTLGQEFTQKVPPSDEEMKVIATMEGDVMVLQITPIKKGKAQKVTRQIVNGELVMKMAIGDVVAVRYFKRTE